jgi:ABC-2 type transport system permease protein
MKKYWHVMKIGTENMLVYRFNFFFRAAVSLVPLLATIYLWQTIYSGQKSDVPGYTLGAMISYYLLVTVVDTLTAVNEDDWQIAADIKDGNISQFLLKPIDYLTYRLCLFCPGEGDFRRGFDCAGRAFHALLAPLFCRPAGLGHDALGAFLVDVLLTACCSSSCPTPWPCWPSGCWRFRRSFSSFCFRIHRGRAFVPAEHPAARAGAGAQLHAVSRTSFIFPVSIYLGQVSGAELWRGLADPGGWVALLRLARLVWQRGIRTYTAVGG